MTTQSIDELFEERWSMMEDYLDVDDLQTCQTLWNQTSEAIKPLLLKAWLGSKESNHTDLLNLGVGLHQSKEHLAQTIAEYTRAASRYHRELHYTDRSDLPNLDAKALYL